MNMHLPLHHPQMGCRLCGGMQSLYLQTLSKFPLDPSLNQFQKALEAGDPSCAFLSIHTLKGLCAQLALPALGFEASQLCQLLREGSVSSLNSAKHRLPRLKVLYQQTVETIEKYVEDNS